MLYFKRKIGWDFYDLNKVNQNKKKTKPRRFVVGYVHGACTQRYNVISLWTCNRRKAGHAKRDLKHSCFDLCIPEAV